MTKSKMKEESWDQPGIDCQLSLTHFLHFWQISAILSDSPTLLLANICHCTVIWEFFDYSLCSTHESLNVWKFEFLQKENRTKTTTRKYHLFLLIVTCVNHLENLFTKLKRKNLILHHKIHCIIRSLSRFNPKHILT